MFNGNLVYDLGSKQGFNNAKWTKYKKCSPRFIRTISFCDTCSR